MLAAIEVSQLLDADRLLGILRAALIVLVGLPAAQVMAVLCGKVVRKRLSQQAVMIVRKVVFYGAAAIVALLVLQNLGVNISALLGAAGIVGIALGFASQTSVSNIISGLFLISERPFEVGDVVQISGTTGMVLSIDLLSAKIRTFDNKFVRIPNETIVKSEVVNITRFPIRRLDINMGVAYKEDIDRVRKILLEIARDNPLCLDEPEPIFVFTNFGDSALEFLFGVWFEKADFLNLRNSLMMQIKNRFDAEGIEIPFPHRTLYAGSVTEPFPVRVVPDAVPKTPQDPESPA